MPKFMNNHYGYSRIFMAADKGGGTGGAEGDDGGAGDGDDRDDDGADDDGDDQDEKKYSQKDVDEAIKKRLAREKRKWQRSQQSKDAEGKDGKEETGETEDSKARKAAEAKASKLEMRIACFEADVSKDAVDDVAALARSYMDADEDLDLEDAIEKVVKKYPQFKKGAADPYEDEDRKPGSWGQRQNGKGTSKLSGVEARFYELNPDLKK